MQCILDKKMEGGGGGMIQIKQNINQTKISLEKKLILQFFI